VGDWIFFFGGLAFVILGIVSHVNRDLSWWLYSRERGWRNLELERDAQWEAQTRRNGTFFIVFGLIFVILGL